MKDMIKHEEKVCPRCKRLFECRQGSITRCQCQAVVIDERLREYLAAHYGDCLCSGCLAELKRELQPE